MRGGLIFTAGFAVMLAAGWAGFPRVLISSTRQPLDFNHRVHAEKASQKCGDCHAISPRGEFAGIPELSSCAACHAEPLGNTATEKALVAVYVKPGHAIPWQSYARQPMNVRFSHAVHVRLGKLDCALCHGPHGNSIALAAYREDRISGYGRNPGSMSMNDCEVCHRRRSVEVGCLGCHK